MIFISKKISISLLFLLIFLSGACISGGGEVGFASKEAIVAEVNGNPVKLSDYKERWHEITNQGDQESLPIAERETLKGRLLERMIEEKVLLLEAQAQNVIPNEQDVTVVYNSIKSGYDDELNFKEALGKAYLTPSELDKRVVRYATIEALLKKEVYPRLSVTDKEVEEYYSQNRSKYDIPEQAEILLITVKTQEEINIIYDELKKSGRSSAEKESLFRQLARHYSISPEAKNDGYLKFARGTMPPFFDETAFSLSVGSYSNPVPSDFGFHLFFLLSRIKGVTKELKDVKPQIERALLAEKAAVAEKEYVEKLKKKAHIERRLQSLKGVD